MNTIRYAIDTIPHACAYLYLAFVELGVGAGRAALHCTAKVTERNDFEQAGILKCPAGRRRHVYEGKNPVLVFYNENENCSLKGCFGRFGER
jgi:hypothetical protein